MFLCSISKYKELSNNQKSTYNISLHLSIYVHIKILMTVYLTDIYNNQILYIRFDISVRDIFYYYYSMQSEISGCFTFKLHCISTKTQLNRRQNESETVICQWDTHVKPPARFVVP